MMEFVKNDGGRKAAGYKTTKPYQIDCVVRSISIALERSAAPLSEYYRHVFVELMELGIEMGGYPSMKPVYEAYLENKGWIKNKCPRDARGKLIKIRHWLDAPARAVVLNSGHLTTIVDGAVHDIWDCRYRPVNSYWTDGETE